MDEIEIVLVGLGGYGAVYAAELLRAAGEHGGRLVAGVDPAPKNPACLAALEEAGVPVYPDLESFYRARQSSAPHLAILAAAIHLHAPLTCQALAHGAYVLCEKPLCASLPEALQMQAAEQRSGRWVAVGYQWSFSAPIQALKRDIFAGQLGRPLRLKTIVLWPRLRSYYQRNDWAGKIRTQQGAWVLDSPAHNAAAHYLHNMLYLLGDQPALSAWPVDVQAEKYRANEIENYDAIALRGHTAQGVAILFYAAHCVAQESGPILQYEFERAVVTYQPGQEGGFVAHFSDGLSRSYGDPTPDEAGKIWQSLDAIRNQAGVACGIPAALPQLLCILGAQRSGEIQPFPAGLVRQTAFGEHDSLTWVEGLSEAFTRAYERNALPSDLPDLPWAKPGSVIRVGDLDDFSLVYPMFPQR